MTKYHQRQIVEAVREVVASFKRCDPIILEMDATFNQLHFDWLDKTRLIQALEHRLGMEIGVHLGDIQQEFPDTPLELANAISNLPFSSQATS